MSCTTCQSSNLCGCPFTLSDICVRYENDKRLNNISLNTGAKLRDALINIDKKIGELELASSGQELTFNPLNNNLTISNGNTVVIPVGENNVKSDWNELDSNSDSFILNKPAPQTLSINGQDLTISLGNTVTLPTTNETVTTLVDNGGSFTYTSEDGTITTVTLPSGSGGIQSVVAGTNITVDNTDPDNPVVSSTDTNDFVTGGSVVGTDIILTIPNQSNVTIDASSLSGGGSSLPSGVLGDTLYHNGTSFIKVTPVTYINTGQTGTTITLPSTPITTNPYWIEVVIGTTRIQGVSYDYTISGDTITLNFSLVASDNILVKYITA